MSIHSHKAWGAAFIGALAFAGGAGAHAGVPVCLRIDPSPLALYAHSGSQQTAGQQTTGQPQGQRAGAPQPGGQRGGGRGGAVAVMTLTTAGFADGATVPLKYTQAGEEFSPPLSWTGAPEPTASFVLIVHDVDALRGNDDTLHWLVWNIPGTTTSLGEHVPQGPQLPDGSRQISATGPYYRGPAAPATGPAHHYLFELYALDTTLDVPPVGASPAETRAAIVAAMAGHIRGKATLVGMYKRSN